MVCRVGMRRLLALGKNVRAKEQIVTTRGYLPGTAVSVAAVSLTEARPTVKFGPAKASALRIVVAGFSVSAAAAGEQDLANDITIVAAIEKISPNSTQVATFSGAGTRTIAAAGSGLIFSDIINMTFAANEVAKTQLEQRVTASAQYLAALNLTGSVDTYRSGLSTGQVGTAGTWSSTSRTSNQNVASAVAVVGQVSSAYPSCCIVGDSISANRDDLSGDSGGNHGYIPIGLYSGGASGAPIPYANLARSGEKIQTLSGSGYDRRLPLLDYCSHVICGLGTNDIADGLATMQSRYLTAWAKLKLNNRKVYQCLIGPKTTSTDSWATETNQTISAGYTVGGVRDQINAWILTQVGVTIDGAINANPGIESATNPGKWLAGTTADGFHPNTAGHAAMAPYVTSVTSTWRVNASGYATV